MAFASTAGYLHVIMGQTKLRVLYCSSGFGFLGSREGDSLREGTGTRFYKKIILVG